MKFFLADSRFPWRSVRRCSLLLCVLLLLTLSSSAQTRRHAVVRKAATTAAVQTDVSAGFVPGAIDIFAGNGNNTATVSGSIATDTGFQGGPAAVATDSYGNIVIATGISGSTPIYMVYAGGTTVPQILATVTTQANPQVPLVKGNIYQINSIATSGSCQTACYTAGNPLSQSKFHASSLWFDSSDNLYIADSATYYSIFKVDHTTGDVTRVAGDGTKGSYSVGGTISGIATNVPLDGGIVDAKTDAYGNIYIADSTDFVVLAVYSATKPDGTTNTQPPPVLLAENPNSNSSDFTPGNIYTIAGQVGNSCYFNWDYSTTVNTYYICAQSGVASGSSPYVLGNANSIAVDASGNVYILDGAMLMVDVISAGVATPPLLTAEGTTPVAGNIYAIVGYNSPNNLAANYLYGGCDDSSPCNDGTANDLWFNTPKAIAADTSGGLYVSDSGEHAVLKIDAAGYTSTVAGIDDPNQTVPAVATIATDKSATETALSRPFGIAFDPSNNLYISDTLYGYYLVWQVAPALAQTITFPTLTTPVTYGVNPIPLGATASSGLDVQYSVSSTSPATVSGSGTSAELNVTGAGTIDVTASQPGNSVYAAATAASGTSLTQHITVNQAPLTVTAAPASTAYGQWPPTYSVTYGLVNGDTAAAVLVNGGQAPDGPAFSTSANSSSPQGTYTFSVSQGSLVLTTAGAANYTLGPYYGNTLTITGNQAQSIQNFSAFTPITYGQVTSISLASVTASSGGPVTFAVRSGDPGTISGSTLTVTGAGTIHITASQTGYEQYEATSAEQDLIVNPAPLTVIAPSLSYTYPTVIATALASALPKVTDPKGNDISAQVTCNACLITNASGTPDVGKYSLTVASGGLTLASSIAANYTFGTFVAGSLTIAQGSQTISDVAPSSITYGGFPTITATSSVGLPVTATVTFTSTTSPLTFISSSTTNPSTKNYTLEWNATGVGAVTITLTQAGTTDYAAATPVVLPFTVGQAPLYLTATNFTREQGAANPTFTYMIGTSTAGASGGFQNGDTDIPSVVSGVPILTTTATQTSSPGTYTIAVDTSAMTSTNYRLVPVSGTLTVTQPGTYAITATNSDGTVNSSTNPLKIQRGLSGQLTITITPSNEYQGTITLACGTLPANVSCTVSPATYTFTGEYVSNGYTYQEKPQKGTITINTTSATVVGANAAQKSNVSLAGFLIPGAFVGLFLLFARKRVAKITTFWSLCALLALGIGATLGLTSCGGSSVNTTATTGTQTITITGTGTTPSGSGTVTATVPLTVTIQ
jgi:hypothetical protein